MSSVVRTAAAAALAVTLAAAFAQSASAHKHKHHRAAPDNPSTEYMRSAAPPAPSK